MMVEVTMFIKLNGALQFCFCLILEEVEPAVRKQELTPAFERAYSQKKLCQEESSGKQ